MKNVYVDKAQALFDEGYACSQSVLLAFADQFGLDETAAKLISSTFGGGMGRLRQKCGALTGAFMVLGLKYGNTDPADMDTKLKSYGKVRDLDKQIEDLYGTSLCAELLKKKIGEEKISGQRSHPAVCRKIVGDTAGILYDMLNQTTGCSL